MHRQADLPQVVQALRLGRRVAIICNPDRLLVPAVQKGATRAAKTQCLNNLRQIGLAMHQYYDATQGRFFLHHLTTRTSFRIRATPTSFAEIYWEDKLMMYIGGAQEADENLSKQGIISASESHLSLPSDPTRRIPFVDPGTGDRWRGASDELLDEFAAEPQVAPLWRMDQAALHDRSRPLQLHRLRERRGEVFHAGERRGSTPR